TSSSKNRGLASTSIGNTVVSKPQPISKIAGTEEQRYKTKIEELNRVLGGGIVPGSLVLVGGDPGIGKSTLLLQVSNDLASQNKRVLYISGEESIRQTKLRADRLDISADELYVLAETNVEHI